MERTSNIMIDLETLGTESGNIIRSISAVQFDLKGNIIRDFHCVIDEEDSKKYGFTECPETLEWWSDKSEEAKSIFNTPFRVSVKLALTMLTEFVDLCRIGFQSLEVWGNSPTLDCVLTRKYYKVMGMDCPFFFFEENDYRTIKKRAVANGFIAFDDFTGIAHYGIDDAKHQIKHLVKMLDFLGIK